MLDMSDHKMTSNAQQSKTILKRSGTSMQFDDFNPGKQVRVLVLYIGGTIGMCAKDGVYEPEANFLVPMLRKLPMFHDVDAAARYMSMSPNSKDQPLVMQNTEDKKRIYYSVFEYEPLLDSANMSVDDYIRLAKDIQDNYAQYDGFVILHGTDTMAYTASALSFMLENLGKPVILTGSQIPICEVRSDGRDNFLSALLLAGHFNIPEVTIVFDNMMLRGNRSTKYTADTMDAFRSPNMTPLATLGVNIHVHYNAIFRRGMIEKFRVHTSLSPNVAVLRLFPHITLQTVELFLRPPIEGVVLQTYGTGNGPSARTDIITAFREATERGVIIVNITQCLMGSVTTSYATGKVLLDAGVLPGSDMTPEAALMKLSYVLGRNDWSLHEKRAKICMNLRGEMKSIPTDTPPSCIHITVIEKLAEAMRISSSEEKHMLQEAIFPAVTLTAAKKGDVAHLKQLRAMGAQFIHGDTDGRTPLHVASAEGHVETVRYLLENGAAVHTRDRYGHSALDDAIRFGRHDVIKLLVAMGAHLVLPPPRIGLVMCNMVVLEGVRGLESWRLAGADLSQADYTGRTPLHVASVMGLEEVVKYLLSHGVSPYVKDIAGRNPIDEAKTKGYANIVCILEAVAAPAQQ